MTGCSKFRISYFVFCVSHFGSDSSINYTSQSLLSLLLFPFSVSLCIKVIYLLTICNNKRNASPLFWSAR